MEYQLSPSILAADFGRLGDAIKEVEAAGVKWLHIDIMDGQFVPTISMGIPIVSSIRKLTDMFFDVHIMANEPAHLIEEFARAGADMITVHTEACAHLDRMLNLILNEKLNLQEMKGARLRIEIGQADLSFMKDIDVTTIFSNLLDNAREAVAECGEERYLSLKMDEAKDFLVICLRNSCPAKRKKRKGHEGLGLVNVRYVVESYGGTMQVSRLKDGYQTSITIPIERREEK